MSVMASQITGASIAYSSVDLGVDQRKHQSSSSLAFVTGEFPAQWASNAENDSIWWRHYDRERRLAIDIIIPDILCTSWSEYSVLSQQTTLWNLQILDGLFECFHVINNITSN